MAVLHCLLVPVFLARKGSQKLSLGAPSRAPIGARLLIGGLGAPMVPLCGSLHPVAGTLGRRPEGAGMNCTPAFHNAGMHSAWNACLHCEVYKCDRTLFGRIVLAGPRPMTVGWWVMVPDRCWTDSGPSDIGFGP